MSKTTNWHTRAIYLMVVLAFVLGLAIVPGTTMALSKPPDPTLVPPNISYNVKGSIHKVIIDRTGWTREEIDGATIDWWLEAGVNLNPNDITVLWPLGPNQYSGGALYQETIKTPGTIDNVPSIEIRSMAEGDIHIRVKITLDGYEWTLQTEKKWGDLCCTDLDVNPDMSGTQHTEDVTVDYGDNGIAEENITDSVTATFLSVPGCVPVGNAIVHLWLLDNTNDNELFVDDLMGHLASTNGSWCDDWSAGGQYTIADPFFNGKQPWQYINDYAAINHANINIFTWNAVNPAVPGEINLVIDPNRQYAWTTTEDNLANQIPGLAWAMLSIDKSNLSDLVPAGVIIVVLVSYPGSPIQQDPFNGENRVCVEKGIKTFTKGPHTEITQVKTPQLRWAGEKIVLEKDWDVAPSYTEDYRTDTGEFGMWHDIITLNLYAAIYSLEEGSIGNLEPISDAAGITVSTPDVSGIYINYNYLGLPAGAQQVICPLGGNYLDFSNDGEGGEGYSDTQAILVSEQSGEADVNAALYEVTLTIQVDGYVGEGPTDQSVEADFNGPTAEHGFLVYFLEFEDVTLANITPSSSITGLNPGLDAAEVAVQVRGFFDYRHSHLMATTRAAKVIDITGNGDYVTLPAGRYVLPDDWVLIAGTKDVSLRPNFDLMDQANLDSIVSSDELGPYDSGVRTTDPPAEAQFPTIGPFSTYQPWSTNDMWIASATVPSSAWWLGYERNTVVPDGTINKWDAPMPQALVIFNVVSDDGTLSGLDKGNLEGYGISGGLYQSPYYAVEIPANWEIPAGYNWMSWERDPSFNYWYYPVQGPYFFWTDLQLGSIIANTHEGNPGVPVNPKDVEVYSDNHGIAAVTVDALDNTGSVTITATADYPYILRGKYGPRVSDGITAIWGGTPLPETITWNCPLGGQPLIAPYPAAGRPTLNMAAACDAITVSDGEELWGIYYLVETGPDKGTWQWYIPGFSSSALTELTPGEEYFVVVSDSCTLTIPQ
jgi:hypothetical protein